MNVISRGIRNTLRSPLRSGAIILMLAISIGLILAMLVAKSSVDAKISEVKATTATGITINPAGMQGGLGGGDPFNEDQVKKIADTEHVAKVNATLTDQLGEEDTNLQPSFELGSLGKRQLRFEGGEASGPVIFNGGSQSGETRTIKPRTNITGTSDPESIISKDKLISGTMIDGKSNILEALVGKNLAEKNSLKVGDSFTAYGQTITIKGIFESDNTFQNNSLLMPLASVQTLTTQQGAVSSITATADSSDNVADVVTSLKATLGDKADIVSQQEQAAESVKPLESIAGLALSGVIGAAIAGAVIILLSMIMIVRERRREIGVIKAIGGTSTKVITQFTAEALTLTVVGGIIGLTLGILVSGPMTQSLVSNSDNEPKLGQMKGGGPVRIGGPIGTFSKGINNNIRNVTSTLTPAVFASSVGILLVITIVGSAVPAWAIARVRPAEVLRTE